MSSFSPSQARTFAAQGAAHRTQLWGALLVFDGGEATVAFSTTSHLEPMETFGFRRVTRGMAILPDSAGITVAVGDKFTQLVGGHTWRIEDIKPDPSTASARLTCLRLDP